MFERNPDSPSVNPSERTEAASPQLHLAIFDLGSRAFVSLRFDQPALLLDEEDDTKLTPARRVKTFHSRHPRYNLPALKSMGFIPHEEEGVMVTAAQTPYMRGVRFRGFTLKRYNLEELHSHVQHMNENGKGTTDTAVLDTAFNTLPELRRYRSEKQAS